MTTWTSANGRWQVVAIDLGQVSIRHTTREPTMLLKTTTGFVCRDRWVPAYVQAEARKMLLCQVVDVV